MILFWFIYYGFRFSSTWHVMTYLIHSFIDQSSTGVCYDAWDRRYDDSACCVCSSYRQWIFRPPLPSLVRTDLLEVTENQNSNIKNDPSIVANFVIPRLLTCMELSFFCTLNGICLWNCVSQYCFRQQWPTQFNFQHSLVLNIIILLLNYCFILLC